MSKSETLKEQSSIILIEPRSWCCTILNSDSELTRGLVLGQLEPGSAWQNVRKKRLKRNPRILGLRGMRGARSGSDRIYFVCGFRSESLVLFVI